MKFIATIVFCFISTQLCAQTKISGYIFDNEKHEPIEGATVFIHDEFNLPIYPSINTLTDENGYYEFTDLEIKRYNVSAYHYYEVAGDTFALVMQPGIVTLTEKLAQNEHTNNFTVIMGISQSYLVSRLVTASRIRKAIDSLGNSKAIEQIRLDIKQVISVSPEVYVNIPDNYYRLYIHYHQKKDW